jgi:hypothetical protein
MRHELRDLIAHGRPEGIAEIAARTRRVLGRLVSLTYDPDPDVAWGAVHAMGVAAARVADDDPAFVRHHLRRLHWLLQEESGGICWRAPEAMAEIVARRPDLFEDYVPIVVHLMLETAEEDLEHFRAGMLWAVGRLGGLAARVAGDVLPGIEAALDHPDPQVRGTAAWCLGRLGRTEALAGRPDLLADNDVCALYEDGALHTVTVGRLVGAAIGTEPRP